VDTQVKEIIGRNYLVNELLAAGLEVAVPMRDRGVDLIAYADLEARAGHFIARPIQLKARWEQAFMLERKYERFPDLLYAFVFNLADQTQTVVYAFSVTEGLAIAEEMGWTKTASWARGAYSVTKPGRRLMGLLEPFRMTRDRWWRVVTGLDATAA
jgi:hypothetical protein